MQMNMDEFQFFDGKSYELDIYEHFKALLDEMSCEYSIKVQKTQISFYNCHMFACVSFAKVKRKAELPPHWLVLTFGLSYPKQSDRIAVCTEAARNRFTHHMVIADSEELDAEIMGWIKEAYEFSVNKR